MTKTCISQSLRLHCTYLNKQLHAYYINLTDLLRNRLTGTTKQAIANLSLLFLDMSCKVENV